MMRFRDLIEGMPEEHRALRTLTHEILVSHGLSAHQPTRHPGLSSHYEAHPDDVDLVGLHKDLVGNGWETDNVNDQEHSWGHSPSVTYTPKVQGRDFYRPRLKIMTIGHKVMASY